jgi:hypothetical protein
MILLCFFAEAAAILRSRVHELEGQLQAKELERRQAAAERDRLEKELADQASRHADQVQQLKDGEELLKAEFESQRSAWAERERCLSEGYEVIEDLLEGTFLSRSEVPAAAGSRPLTPSSSCYAECFPDHAGVISQAIEERREQRRQVGEEIAPDRPRTLGEQFRAVQLRLVPVRRLLRRFQRAGSRVLEGLWPGVQVPRTPSRTADWLEVAAERLDAWKGAAARAGAKTALEFVKAWYPGVGLAQLETFRLEAVPELEAQREAIAIRAAALADYADVSVFVPERAENGVEVPPSWFGLNPDEVEDPAEEVASSDESAKGDEGEDGDVVAPDGEATSRVQHDPALASEPREATSAATAADQTETNQPEAPPAGASAATDLSKQPAAPSA